MCAAGARSQHTQLLTRPLCTTRAFAIASLAAFLVRPACAFSRNLNSTGTDVYPLTPGSTHNLIAAWASGGVKDPVACDSNYPKHKGDWKGHVSF